MHMWTDITHKACVDEGAIVAMLVWSKFPRCKPRTLRSVRSVNSQYSATHVRTLTILRKSKRPQLYPHYVCHTHPLPLWPDFFPLPFPAVDVSISNPKMW